jgi:hypothetical protein
MIAGVEIAKKEMTGIFLPNFRKGLSQQHLLTQ